MNIDPQIERQREIVLKALEKPTAAERAAYLDGACGNDAALRREVELLLRHDTEGSFLQRPAMETGRSTTGESIVSEAPGTMIGRYKLLQKIGEGGCGVVYMAEQEEPVRRRVALKVIKLGMDTTSVIARFEAERQALALMDHPNIAKVFDAGATESPHPASGHPLPSNGRGAGGEGILRAGRPYFVMELVRGVKITDYCDEKKLSTQERLDLFVQVCHAVQHAHQKGIIHRDLKPSNILVNIVDGLPVPKVIDFGIAKATNDQRLTDKTVFTAFEQFIGTPAYMSPEQAEISGVDVDTRSDIYSLGVLLYELLTGKTPFDAKELLQAGLDEMRRTIREKEPDRPSTRVSTLGGEELTSTAKRRGLEAPKLVNSLRGDLDWIVMKCLEKDRARRYETANGLAMDIRRHLNQEPVVACPPSRIYRFQKLVRRNRGAFAAAAMFLVLLVAGAGVSTWLAVKARRSAQEQARLRALAEDRGTEAQQISRFLQEMLSEAKPEVARGRDAALLLEVLDKADARVGKELAAQPAVEAQLRRVMGGIYNGLGKYQKAEATLRRALAIEQSLHPAGSLTVALTLDELGRAVFFQGNNLAEAEALFVENQAMLRKFAGNDDRRIVISLLDLGRTLQREGKLSEAEAVSSQALDQARKSLGNEDGETGSALTLMGEIRGAEGDNAAAERFLRQGLVVLEKALGRDDQQVGMTLNNLAVAIQRQGRLAEAAEIYQQALAVQRKILGPGHPELAAPLINVASALSREGKLEEAEELAQEAVEVRRRAFGSTDYMLAHCISVLARILTDENKAEEAERLCDDYFSAAPSAQTNVFLLQQRAELFARRGRWKEAAADLRRAIDVDPTDHGRWHRLAPLLVQAGDMETYREYCRRSLERFRDTTDPRTADRIAKDCLILATSGVDLNVVSNMAEVAVTQSNEKQPMPWFQFCKGLVEYRQGHFSSALEWAEKANTEPAPSLQLETFGLLAMARYRLGQVPEAQAALAKATEVADAKLPHLDSGDVGSDPGDLIIGHALLTEAKALIRGQMSNEVVQSPASKVQGRPEAGPAGRGTNVVQEAGRR